MKIATRLALLKENLEKRRGALIEDVHLDRYINKLSFEKPQVSPFPHLVIEDFFNTETYEELRKYFNAIMERGFSQEDDVNRFHPFLNLKGEFAYDGYVYVPELGESPLIELFSSVVWNQFFTNIFKQPTGRTTSFAFHHHPIGDRTGFVHSDYASKLFTPNDRLLNGIVYRDWGKGQEGNSIFPQRRIIALIYYFGNEEWKEGDGGGTGLYASKSGSPAKIIEPKNNSMLVFQISPRSFHAFQQNFAPRSSMVQWFHVDEAWAMDTYGFL